MCIRDRGLPLQEHLISTLNEVDSYEMSEPNVLMLDQAEYALDDEDYRPCEEVLRIDNILRAQLGYPLKMEALAQPWKMCIRDRSTCTLRSWHHSMRETTYIKLCVYGRNMKLPNAAVCLLTAAGGNPK